MLCDCAEELRAAQQRADQHQSSGRQLEAEVQRLKGLLSARDREVASLVEKAKRQVGGMHTPNFALAGWLADT